MKREYNKETNMTFTELLRWSKTPQSQEVSIKTKDDSIQARKERRKLLEYLPLRVRKHAKKFNTAQIRNLSLLYTTEWDKFLESQGKKAVSYLKRAKKIKGKNTRNNIYAMRNWGFNKLKSS